MIRPKAPVRWPLRPLRTMRDITKRCQFIVLDILAFILGKAKQEYSRP
jgi:hypothetical protein